MTTFAPSEEQQTLPTPNRNLFEGLDSLIPAHLAQHEQAHPNFERLPGHPQTRLVRSELLEFLEKDFCTPRLDKFSRWLWLVVTPDSTHVSSLTHQIVRGREITVTENPELHLVWHEKRIFVKPMPPFLLSNPFWKACFSESSRSNGDNGRNIHRSLFGFMRSYRLLIQHPSDFALAVDKRLIPVDCNASRNTTEDSKIDFAAFIAFMDDFDVTDAKVSLRFHYGDLRLSRLNFWAKFVLGQFTFSKAYGNYDAYFSRFYGPLLFHFSVLSIIISSIQLGFTSQAGLGTVHNGWRPLYRIGSGLCVAILLFIGVIAVSLLGLFVFMGLRELIFALRHWTKRRKDGNMNKDVEGVAGKDSSATSRPSP